MTAALVVAALLLGILVGALIGIGLSAATWRATQVLLADVKTRREALEVLMGRTQAMLDELKARQDLRSAEERVRLLAPRNATRRIPTS